MPVVLAPLDDIDSFHEVRLGLTSDGGCGYAASALAALPARQGHSGSAPISRHRQLATADLGASL